MGKHWLAAIALACAGALPLHAVDLTQTGPQASAAQILATRLADVDYRVEFNEAAQDWDVLRNGAATPVMARKKKASAIASAIRDAKAEHSASSGRIMVTCREGRILQTLWKSS